MNHWLTDSDVLYDDSHTLNGEAVEVECWNKTIYLLNKSLFLPNE